MQELSCNKCGNNHLVLENELLDSYIYYCPYCGSKYFVEKQKQEKKTYKEFRLPSQEEVDRNALYHHKTTFDIIFNYTQPNCCINQKHHILNLVEIDEAVRYCEDLLKRKDAFTVELYVGNSSNNWNVGRWIKYPYTVKGGCDKEGYIKELARLMGYEGKF